MTTGRQGAADMLRLVVDQAEEIVASLALVVVVAAVSWGVVTRYITAQPAAWASEIATLAFAWVVFFGAAGCVKYHLHPTIDLLVVRLAPLPRTLVRGLNHILLLAFFGYMMWFGTRFAIDALATPTAVLRLPLAWLYGAVTVAFVLMTIRYLQVLAGKRWRIETHRETHAG